MRSNERKFEDNERKFEDNAPAITPEARLTPMLLADDICSGVLPSELYIASADLPCTANLAIV